MRGTGFTCNGAPVGNIVQSDGIKADVSFSVIQSRDNGSLHLPRRRPKSPADLDLDALLGELQQLLRQDVTAATKLANTATSDYHDYSWSDSWSCKGTDNKDDDYSHKECTKNATLDAGNTAHSQALTTPSLSTTGYHTITLSYDRATSGGAATKLVVDFSTDGGTTWTTLETVTGNSPNSSKTFSLSPSADNKPSVKVRFTLTGTSASNTATIDNVVVTGVTP